MNLQDSVIAVGMSGGVDSSTAAALLVHEGRRVIGMTMRFHHNDGDASDAGHCAPAVRDARAVAERLGIPHHVIDLADRFERDVVSVFTGEYAAGRTPNPCVHCNRQLKFGGLLDHARALGADALATGHYARIGRRDGRPMLRCAVDPVKDQSYFLSGLSQEQLARVQFPLGEYRKEDTRRRAREMGLPVADKSESMEICFVPNDDYRTFLDERIGPPRPGPIISSDGRVLGEHNGLRYYTIGQRKGLGIAAERPLYVIRIDAERNALVVGFEDETYSGELSADQANWFIDPPAAPFECEIKIRYNQRPVPCRVIPDVDGPAFHVRFRDRIRAIAPGQSAVLYDDEYVIGSGIIASAVPAH